MSGFYSFSEIDKTGAHYRMVFGERSNGKTYGALVKMLENYWESGKQSAYIRRYREDFTGKRGQTLFSGTEANNEIERITDGEWNSVYFWSGRWYLQFSDGVGKPVRDEKPFCYAFALSSMEHDKSTSYPNINLIVFDEFLTRDFYLNNEFVLFCNVLSTIVRQRKDVTIYMLGNTVNQYCPYFYEMGLTGIKEMNQGEIEIYEYGDSGLKVAVEYAPELDDDIKESKVLFAFDNPSLQMINSGKWEFDLYPHLEYKILPKNIKLIYFIEFDNELLQCEIVRDENGIYTFIHRKTTEIKYTKDIVFTQRVDASLYHFRRINKPTNEKTKLIWNLLQTENVFFQDNSVGEIVRNYLAWCQRTEMFHT